MAGEPFAIEHATEREGSWEKEGEKASATAKPPQTTINNKLTI